MLIAIKKRSFTSKLLILNSLILFIFYITYSFKPDLDISIAKLFYFENSHFLADEYTFIKDLRSFTKNLMIALPILSLILIIKIYIDFKKRNLEKKSLRFKKIIFTYMGFIIGPIVGCGLIANLYFKDTWGRARPVHIVEFNGEKLYTPPFEKSDQCEKNCSWIGGEVSAAFSFLTGVLIIKKSSILFRINIIFGILVAFCRMAMGGHFFSDNLFAAILMIYLALFYRFIFYYLTKRRLI